MDTFLANEINTTKEDITDPTVHVQTMFPLKDKKCRVFEDTFWKVFVDEDLKVRDVKPATVNQQCLVYKFQCNLCDTGYVGYTRGHHERVDGHKQKSSSI